MRTWPPNASRLCSMSTRSAMPSVVCLGIEGFVGRAGKKRDRHIKKLRHNTVYLHMDTVSLIFCTVVTKIDNRIEEGVLLFF